MFQRKLYSDEKKDMAARELNEALMAVFKEHSSKSDDERKVGVILFLQESLVSLGMKRSEIMKSGRFAEIIAAIELGGTVNPILQGVDIVTPTGNIELKSSSVSLGEKVNVNIQPPVKEHGISVEAYKTLFLEETKNKGLFRIEHRYGLKDDERTIYEFQPEFIAALVLHKNSVPDKHRRVKWDKKVNIGGICCKMCKSVHRLVTYKELETEYLKDNEKFDESKFDTMGVNPHNPR